MVKEPRFFGRNGQRRLEAESRVCPETNIVDAHRRNIVYHSGCLEVRHYLAGCELGVNVSRGSAGRALVAARPCALTVSTERR